MLESILVIGYLLMCIALVTSLHYMCKNRAYFFEKRFRLKHTHTHILESVFNKNFLFILNLKQNLVCGPSKYYVSKELGGWVGLEWPVLLTFCTVFMLT